MASTSVRFSASSQKTRYSIIEVRLFQSDACIIQPRHLPWMISSAIFSPNASGRSGLASISVLKCKRPKRPTDDRLRVSRSQEWKRRCIYHPQTLYAIDTSFGVNDCHAILTWTHCTCRTNVRNGGRTGPDESEYSQVQEA